MLWAPHLYFLFMVFWEGDTDFLLDVACLPI